MAFYIRPTFSPELFFIPLHFQTVSLGRNPATSPLFCQYFAAVCSLMGLLSLLLFFALANRKGPRCIFMKTQSYSVFDKWRYLFLKLPYCQGFFVFFVTVVSLSLVVVVFESWRFKFVFPYPHINPQVEFIAVVFQTDARGVSPASVTVAKKSTTPFQPVTLPVLLLRVAAVVSSLQSRTVYVVVKVRSAFPCKIFKHGIWWLHFF